MTLSRGLRITYIIFVRQCLSKTFYKLTFCDIIHGRIFKMCKLKATREMILEVIPPHSCHNLSSPEFFSSSRVWWAVLTVNIISTSLIKSFWLSLKKCSWRYYSIETWTSLLQILHIFYHTPYTISDKSGSSYYSQNNDWF